MQLRKLIFAILDSRPAECVVAVGFFWMLYDTGWFAENSALHFGGFGYGALALVAVSWLDDILFD